MKAESMQLFTIPITQNYQGVPFAPNHGDASYLPTYLQGCVPPLLEVALNVGPPSLSMLCIMSTCYTLQLMHHKCLNQNLLKSNNQKALPDYHSYYHGDIVQPGLDHLSPDASRTDFAPTRATVMPSSLILPPGEAQVSSLLQDRC